MSTVKFGITSWDEVEIKQPGAARNKDMYMRLGNGNNVIRCVTKPHEYSVHNFKEEGDAGFGAKIKCSAPLYKSCPVCDLGDKAKRRWLVGIIDRKTQSYKVLDMSVSIFKSIQELSRDEDYGNPEGYDIDIKVNQQGGANGYYTVIPKPRKPLSAHDLDLKSKVDSEELLRQCTPPTVEKTAERLAHERAKKNGAAPARTAPMTNNAAPEVASDDEFVFPAVNG